MTNATAALARSITWASSKQSYLTARLLADLDLVDDCLRAYAYFRWADDRIDVYPSSNDERVAFLGRQESLISKFYQGQRPEGLSPEETMLADLVAHDRAPDGGLHSFIHHFMSVMAFDAGRRGRTPSRQELSAYTNCLATAVMDGIQYFIGNDQSYPKTYERNLAVTGAHITHMLRDMLGDISNGLVNISAEDLEAYAIDMQDLNNERFRYWVRKQVELARYCFQAGKAYIDSLEVLRCKLAGVWYCARFACILNAIEKDGYRLRTGYCEHHALKTWLEMARLGIVVTIKHFARRIRLFFLHLDHLDRLNANEESQPNKIIHRSI